MPDRIGNIASKYTKKWGKVFAVDLLLSAVTYSLMMIHQLVNQLDGLWHGSESVAAGWELSIGRWLWRYIDKARFHISPDPLTSLITIILFILATLIMLEIFDVKGMFRQIFISMMFLASVSVCNHVSFRFQSPTFGFGIFFAAVAVLVLVKTDKARFAIPFAAIFVALANACYQAFTGAVCALVVLYIAYCIRNNTKDNKELGIFTIRSLVAGLGGVTVYYAILKAEMFRYDIQMTDYNGASDYNIKGIITNLPIRFRTTYHAFFEYFGNRYYRINIVPAFRWMYFALILLVAVIALLAVAEIRKQGIARAVIYVICLLLLPCATNAFLIIAYDSFVSIQMTVPMAFALAALLAFALNGDLVPKTGKIVGCATWCVVAVLLYTQFYMVQYDQQSMYMGRQSCLTMADQIDSYLIKHDLLHPYYKYVFVGTPSGNKEFYLNDFFGTANEYAQFGNFTSDPGGARMSWQGLWWYERGIRMDFAPPDKWEAMLEDPAVAGMPVFPEEGSCVFYNDVVVVKVSE